MYHKLYLSYFCLLKNAHCGSCVNEFSFLYFKVKAYKSQVSIIMETNIVYKMQETNKSEPIIKQDQLPFSIVKFLKAVLTYLRTSANIEIAD